MRARRLLIAALCIAALTLCAGCDEGALTAREVENLEMIRTVGMDWDGDAVTVTVCTGSGGEGDGARLVTARGESPAQAVENLRRGYTGSEAYFAYTEHVLLGTGTERLLPGVLDLVTRSSDMRMALDLYAVQGLSARELMARCQGQSGGVTEMLTALRREAPRRGMGAVYSCADVAAALAETGDALIQAVRAVPSPELSEGAPECCVEPAGFAVLRDGSLAGFVQGRAVPGILLLREELKMTTQVIDGVTLELVDAKTELTRTENGSVRAEVSVCAVVVEDASGVPITQDRTRRDLEEALAASLRECVTAALTRGRELETDLCALGQKLGVTDPEQVRALSAVPWEISVTAVIARSYDTADPITPREGTT